MCGIIGYATETASSDTIDILLNGLGRLEYRGYDSAGIALHGDTLAVEKRAGELSVLTESVNPDALNGEVGVGHTRWSTHGPPTDENAHPHTDCSRSIAVVHNGIIENYATLRDELEAAGHTFESETDTEVIPHLLEEELSAGRDAEVAFRRVVDRLDGSYAIAAVLDGDRLFGARESSPLVVGIGDHGRFLASDVPAFIEYTDRVIYLEDGETVAIDGDQVTVRDREGSEVDKAVDTIDWEPEDAGKSGYEHFMRKEINEQPTAIRQCLHHRVEELSNSVTVPELNDVTVDEVAGVHLVAAGTSYHAARYGARLLGERGIPAQAFISSEYNAEAMPIPAGTVVIGVSQSGETADTLGAMRSAKRAGADVVAVTNVIESSAARTADHALYIRAGPEIGVAATKTFGSQVVALSLLASAVTDTVPRGLIEHLRGLPDQIQSILDTTEAKPIAEEYVDADAYFFLGRGWNVPVALEGALKMKEITYKHAEGFPAGELKHGPLALVTADTPVFATVTKGCAPEKMLGNVKEVEARDAPVIVVTDIPERVSHYADDILEIPSAGDRLTPVLANVQLQLVSYWVANFLGRSIDKPRNLAKSVTVQ